MLAAEAPWVAYTDAREETRSAATIRALALLLLASRRRIMPSPPVDELKPAGPRNGDDGLDGPGGSRLHRWRWS
jgi:hypothetical protein